MARPITWQNVNAPSNSDAVNLLRGATTGIDGAFDKFGAIIKEREAAQANNQLALQNNAKTDHLTFLQSLKTPEEFTAAQMSGVLDQRLQALPKQVQGQVLGSGDARLTALRQQATAGNEYADSTEKRAARPLIEQANMFVQNNDPAGLKTFMTENLGKIPDPAQFLGAVRAVGNTVQNQEFAVNKDKREGLKTDQEIKESKAQIEQARVNGLATANAAREAAAGKNIDATLKALELLGGKGGAGSGQGGDRAGNVDTLLKNLVPDEDTRAKMAGKIAPLMGNPLYKELTDRELVSIAMQTKDQRGVFNSTFGIGKAPDTVESMADAIVKSPDYIARTAQGDVVEGMRRNLAQSLYAGVGGAPVPTTTTPSLPTIPVPTEPAAKPTVSEAAAAIRGSTLAPESPASRGALPDYKGKAVNTEPFLTVVGRDITNFSNRIDAASQKMGAQAIASDIEQRLESGSYIAPGTVMRAQEASKKNPDQFTPAVLDWLTRTQGTPAKKAK